MSVKARRSVAKTTSAGGMAAATTSECRTTVRGRVRNKDAEHL